MESWICGTDVSWGPKTCGNWSPICFLHGIVYKHDLYSSYIHQMVTILRFVLFFLSFLSFFFFLSFFQSIGVRSISQFVICLGPGNGMLPRTREMNESHQCRHCWWWPVACNNGKNGVVLYSQFWSSKSTQSSGQTILTIFNKTANISQKVRKVLFLLKKPTKTRPPPLIFWYGQKLP